MNDRFKFRIWHEPLKQMHYNDFIVTATGYMAKIYQQDDYMMKFNQEDLEFDKQCILMQCTGLKDKNGKLIYEGDIVKETVVDYIDEEFLTVVCWDNLKASYNIDNTIRCEREVIGNIYENKEVLDERN